MENHVGYSVIRNYDYSQPFEEGVINKGQKEHHGIHIVSKTCLDVFLPLPDHGTGKKTIHKGSASHRNEKRDVESRQKPIIEDAQNSATSKVSSVDVASSTPTREQSLAFTDEDSNVDGGVRNCSKDGGTIMKGKKIQPPLVVFGYGGGWRRGDKQTWRHYISRWDINFGLAAFVGRDRYYSNIGESFVSRGIPCAVLSYPLVPTPFPINLFEIGSSLLLSFVVTLLLALSSTLMLDILLISLPYPSLMQRSWHFLQNHSDYPILTAIAAVTIFSQLLTLGVMVYRELSLKSHDQSESRTSLSKLLPILCAFVTIVCTVLTLDIYSLCSYITSSIRLMLAVSGAIVLLVQYLVYHFQQMTTYDQMSSRSCLVANPKGQAECVALALKWLVEYGRSTGHFDPESLVLMGHSAGGHLLSLVALDHHYLTDVGVNPRIIKGVITMSAVHNLRSISEGLPYHIYLKPAFGKDPSYWTSMSPIEYIKLDEKAVRTVLEPDSRPSLSAPSSSSVNTTIPTTLRSRLSSSNTSAPHRPRFLIISAANDFDIMIRDSEMMHSTLEINGYQTRKTFIQGCNHFTMVKKFGCPWYRYWTGLLLGKRCRGWEPTDGELMCWDFVRQFWNCE